LTTGTQAFSWPVYYYNKTHCIGTLRGDRKGNPTEVMKKKTSLSPAAAKEFLPTNLEFLIRETCTFFTKTAGNTIIQFNK
jgi:hypothetical protein